MHTPSGLHAIVVVPLGPKRQRDHQPDAEDQKPDPLRGEASQYPMAATVTMQTTVKAVIALCHLFCLVSALIVRPSVAPPS